MADILTAIGTQTALQVATLSFLGAIVVSIISFITKKIEIDSARRREIVTEKIKYISQLENYITDVVYTCSEEAIPGIEDKLNTFFASKQKEIRDIVSLLGSGYTQRYYESAIDLLISFDFFVKEELKISHFTVADLSKHIIKMSPWIIARETFIIKSDEIIDTADSNRMKIEDELKRRREQAKESFTILMEIHDPSMRVQLFNTALLEINKELNLELTPMHLTSIIKTFRDEVYHSDARLKLSQRFFLKDYQRIDRRPSR